MVKGFKATLFAGVISLSAFAPAFAAAPVISGLPDVQIGDLEDSASTDSNLFVFSNAFSFDAYVNDTDTPDNLLKWSFGEFTNPAVSSNQNNQYTINGVAAVNQGDAAIAADQAAGNPLAKNPVANQIDASSDLATFRDILFSPAAGTAPFPEQSAGNKTAAAAGKFLRFYVADPEGNLGFQDVLVKTVDDDFDLLTATDGYQELFREENFASGWLPSGAASEGVAIAAGAGELNIIVTPATAKQRVHGWRNNELIPYDSVGSTKFVRGKFFVYTNAAANAPMNTVPNFRLRLIHETAVNASAHFEYATSGASAPPYEPFYGLLNDPTVEALVGPALRPSALAGTPSLYRVDLDPIDVPAAAGSKIGALIESFSVQDPANAILSLTEVVMATYDAKTDTDSDASLVYSYNRATGLGVGAGGAKVAAAGAFNHEASGIAGRRQDLYIPGFDAGPYYTQTDAGVNGIVGDTDLVATTVFGIGNMNISSVNNADKLRIEPNALYRAKFFATSSVPTSSANPAVETQAALRFRFQTAKNTLSYLLDLTPQLGAPLGGFTDAISAQALPGLGSQNPETEAGLDFAGEDGGWYSVIVPSPLDVAGIRQDTANNFGAFGAEPGPGSASDSGKDVTLGVDFIQVPLNLEVLPGVSIPYGRPNRGLVRLGAIEVFKYPSIDDGGYDF